MQVPIPQPRLEALLKSCFRQTLPVLQVPIPDLATRLETVAQAFHASKCLL